MTDSFQTGLRRAIQLGLLAGVVALSLSMIGMVELFGKRSLIFNVMKSRCLKIIKFKSKMENT